MTQSETKKIDWLKAAILERADAHGFSQQDVADLAGISRTTLNDLMQRSPVEWKPEHRKKVLSALGIRVRELPEDVQLLVAQSLA